MKLLKTIILLPALIPLACQPTLDLSPKGYQTTSSYYRTAADAQAAVTGAYSQLRHLYSNEILNAVHLGGTDDAVPFLTGSADRIALWTYNVVSTNSYVTDMWTSLYKAVQLANIVIGRVPGIDMDPNLKQQYIGEAKFLRALSYFNLVRFFGDVPLVDKETLSLKDVALPRTAEADLYNFIIADLEEAAGYLPAVQPAGQLGRATSGAANGLLAKVYLTRAGNTRGSEYWTKAAEKARLVIESGRYDLWENYADVYDLRNRCGKESLFEVMFLTDLAGNAFPTGYAPRGAPIVPNNGYGIVRVTQNLFDSYADNDRRKAVSFLTSYVHPATGDIVKLSATDPNPALAVSFWKLADLTSKIVYQGGKSFPLLRYSDILLIYAEALSEAGNGPTPEAYAALNKVRLRAGLSPLNNLSAAEFKDAVLKERRLEFCFEGNRWFDLVRTGRLVQTIKADHSFGRNATIGEHHTHYPIPQRELDVNSALVQNDGY